MRYVDFNIELAHLDRDKYALKLHSPVGEVQVTIQLSKPETMEETGRVLWYLYTPPPENADRLPVGIYEYEFGASMFRSITDAKGALKLYESTGTYASRRRSGR